MAVKIVGAKRKKTGLIITLSIIFGIIIILCGAGFAGFKYYQSMENKYKKQISNYKSELEKTMRIVLVPKEDIKYNTKLEEGMVVEREILSDVPQENYMNKDDIGKLTKIPLEKEIPIMKSTLIDEKIEDDVREVKYNMFLFRSNIEKNEFIDFRISFPNGEDYIIASKKKVENVNIKLNTVWTWLDEREIMTMSSALVDAYLRKGTTLYIVKYVQPDVQKKASSTYPVNEDVIKAMQNDPNILNKAYISLAYNARKQLQERIVKLPKEQMDNINTGLTQEKTQIQTAIDASPTTELKPNENKETSTNNEPKATDSNTTTTNNDKGSDTNGFFN